MALIAGWAGALACTDANLKWKIPADAPALRMQSIIRVCSPPPARDDVPYKILFVIDTSASNITNDTRERRRAAYLSAIETYAGKPNVHFGIIAFSDTAHRPTVTFTQNLSILENAAGAFGNSLALGATNYEDALTALLSFIIDDLQSTSEATARKTRYHVYWISDGFPTKGTQDRDTLAANVESILTYVEARAASFVLNAFYLEPVRDGTYSPDEITKAAELLRSMALAGNGVFTDIRQSDASFEFNISPVPLFRPMKLRTVVASNRHAHYGEEHPLPDSDADGLTDAREAFLATDPSLADSDGDGYRDGVEVQVTSLDPLTADSGCTTETLDSDGDSLFDCEEVVLATSELHLDSDRDLLPDWVEFSLGSSPVSDDPKADQDLDQLLDWDEVAAHLSPLSANTQREAELWSYRYKVKTEEVQEDGRTCYEMNVGNVGVFETLATADHPAGAQRIDVYATFETKDQEVRVARRATAPVGFLEPDRQQPATGVFELLDEDFATFED